jgi:hypothetical protein
MFTRLFLLYMVLSFGFGIFGTMAWLLSMTSATLLFIWIWWTVPAVIIFIMMLGGNIDKYQG